MPDIDLAQPYFTTSDVLQVLQVEEPVFQHWLQRGLLPPDHGASSRSGPERYSAGEIIVLTAVAKLSRLGVSPRLLDANLSRVVRANAAGHLAQAQLQAHTQLQAQVLERMQQSQTQTTIAAATDPDLEPHVKGRYVIVYYDAIKRSVDWSVSATTDLDRCSKDVASIVIDTHKLADIVMAKLEFILSTAR